MSASPIARAVAELETERQNLQARLGKVDEAIASLRALFHLPAARETTKARNTKVPDPEHRSSKGGDTTAAIRAALSNGPLSPGALAIAVGMERANLRRQLTALEAEGLIVSSGTTASRRIALAKEGL